MTLLVSSDFVETVSTPRAMRATFQQEIISFDRLKSTLGIAPLPAEFNGGSPPWADRCRDKQMAEPYGGVFH